MSFKKITIEEIRSAEYENIIGLAMKSFTKIAKESKLTEGQDILHTHRRLILEFNRYNTFMLDKDEMSDLNQENHLILRNPSQKDKVWNIRMNLEEIQQDIIIDEISPNDYWDYALEKKSDITQNLSITEVIQKKSYAKESGENSEYFLQSGVKNQFYFVIFVKNISNQFLEDIQITKKLPGSFTSVVEIKSTRGEISKQKSHFLWKIEKINPSEEFQLKFSINLDPNPCNTGKITGHYSVQYENENLFHINNFRGSVKTAQFINIDELDEKPGFWDCSFEILNRSDFLINISDAKASQIDDSGKHTLFQKNNITLNPYEEKVVYKQIIESEDRPKISKSVLFNPEIEIINNETSSFSMTEEKFELLEISASKEFSQKSIKSFEVGSFDVTLKIKNESTLPINQILLQEVSDTIFKPQNIENMQISLNEKSFMVKDLPYIFSDGNRQEKDIGEIKQNLLIYKEKVQDLESEYNELQQQLKSDKFESLSSVKDNLVAKKESLSGEINEYKNGIQNQQQKIKELLDSNKKFDEEIKKYDEILSDLNAQMDLFNEKTKYENELKNQSKVLDTIKKQLDKNQKKLAKTEEKLSIEEDEAAKGKLEQKIEEISKESNRIESHETQIKEKIEEINQSIQKHLDKLNFTNLKTLKSQITKEKSTQNGINSQIKTNKVEIETCEQMEIRLKSNLTTAQDNSASLSDDLKNASELGDQRSKLIAQRDEIEKSIKQTKNKVATSEQEGLTLERQSEMIKLISLSVNDLKKMFSAASQESESKVELYSVSNDSNSQLIIELRNIEEMLGSFNPGSELEIQYSLAYNRAKNDVEYEFPSSILFDTKPAKAIHYYPIPSQNLPLLEIIHERKKISLGKIIDHYPEKGKFQVLLIVKNKGQSFIDELKIIDHLPKSAIISNAYYKYEEHEVSNDLKEIIWELKQIAPLEEIEITYLVDLGSEDYDLNEFELLIE
jgi:hypothetical protein